MAKTWICALHIIWNHGIYTIRVLELLYAFKNVRNMEKFLEENAHAPDGTQPILARETMA